MNAQGITFYAFKDAWLEDVVRGDPSTVQLGHRFAEKLVGDWLDADSSSLDIVYCDGTGDGGIDVAVLESGASSADDESAVGDTWYLVQSKYGAAFAGVSTLLIEGQKVIDTLDGRRASLSSLSAGIIERISNFRQSASGQDKIVLTFATVNALNDEERRALDDLRAMGRNRLGSIFDVTAVSLQTIYDRLADEAELAAQRRLTVPLSGHLVEAGNDLLVGSVSLVDLYAFLKDYRARTDDLDQLFEKNVRRFLGGKVKVNKSMQTTLREAPEKFGLFNNGITIVVSDYQSAKDNSFDLVEPYVVNGCQTTRTIYEVCSVRIDSGGTGSSPELDDWRKRAARGCVVTKIAKVGTDGEALLQAITRFTNSQNAVREKDFIALSGDFRSWHANLAEKYGIYLEIQRGSWDSQRALQKQRPNLRAFDRYANATELMKVYGAGWLGEAGLAFGKVPPFLPNGSVFKKIMDLGTASDERPFGVDDLYAAYLLQQSAERLEFGRGGPQSRRQTKFVYYLAFVNLLRDVLQRANLPANNAGVTDARLKLNSGSNSNALNELEQNATELVDTYMTEGDDNSVLKEPEYRNAFNFDLNAFFKWERLGKTSESTPRLFECLAIQKRFMGIARGQAPSQRQVVTDALLTEIN